MFIMKVYINNRNYLTWPKRQAEWLSTQGHEAIFIDNESTYEPLLDWYEHCEHTVHRLTTNHGPASPWRSALLDLTDYYAVTDPDLDFEGIPEDWPEVCIEAIQMGESKCGFSLDETLIPSQNPAWIQDEFNLHPRGDHPARWAEEHKFGRYIRYPTETTFAVYPPGGSYHIGGCRTDRPYTARHLPWHIVLERDPGENSLQIVMDEEIYYYFSNASHLSVTTGRMSLFLEEYERTHSINPHP